MTEAMTEANPAIHRGASAQSPDATPFVPVPTPAGFPASPVARALQQPLLLGLFLPIQAGGWSASTLPRTTDWNFDYNLALVQKAESLGFDLVFALSQWLPKGGYGGVFNGEALDSFMSLAAMTACTERIILVATSHVLYGPWHPLHFAKFSATLDHISKGRWGINVVTGHRAIEHEMFGWHRIEHDRRYELAGEFLDAVQQLWAQPENFSFAPLLSSWKLNKAFVTPKPQFGRPLLVNATGSDAGIEFAARYSDVVFITSPAGPEIEAALAALPTHTARVKAAAAKYGRKIRTLINPMVICRETAAEALAYRDAIVAHGDEGSFHRFDSDAHAWRGNAEQRNQAAARAVGGNISIVGSPQQIADYIVRLHRAGVDGVQLSFFDFQPDLEFFGARVLPLLREAGLRA
ncbi:LLM class flavin-dependent oxidoreductase [bacterium M00.F.Ca.ET.228.01.1.1]|nr:LLM class flavin-dependent oxidoreductase [Paraburkholderia phenoliruptrix]TGP42673.1 LLM class flavin-dependent oxidoreductase [bacterium M00.F.Ca.ET.228.01.1.1]TGR95398.1 LLM class flavin-dependent oxidoreductase [bacterium M00.F.Ca.ET.191.01.1.1]TGT96287.1 LLM class flavin-dependent oxidoreductase [bacterium M00.F.Ca.ET.155.01.1.1]MBW0447417.1 LLM class flavin-dependent oxidoreductase [Paraburkholderia phenoliruptrix]MBW9098903.1 LLM class flavin-dependent oxidoreductase [Paraburkholderi